MGAITTYEKVAALYAQKGFALKAIAVYKQILKLDPRLVEVNLKLAELYGDLGRHALAVRERRATWTCPRRHFAWGGSNRPSPRHLFQAPGIDSLVART